MQSMVIESPLPNHLLSDLRIQIFLIVSMLAMNADGSASEKYWNLAVSLSRGYVLQKYSSDMVMVYEV